jgi:pyruvate/2-oxoglutarate dehydrogenase complex dihydrolipoamide dehydrogenase (E3) component
MKTAQKSQQLLRTPTAPEKLLIVGAGYLGCEFASIDRTLGRAVTIVEQKDRVLPGWEPEAGERVAQALLSQGVALLLNQHVTLGQDRTERGHGSFPTTWRRSIPFEPWCLW